MEPQWLDEWEGHGEKFTTAEGEKLLVIDYGSHAKTKPNHGNFGAMTFADSLENAKELAQEFLIGKTHKLLLGMPVLIYRVHSETEP